jgi:hypothetical protein
MEENRNRRFGANSYIICIIYRYIYIYRISSNERTTDMSVYFSIIFF